MFITGLQFNVVHPIPIEYLERLNAEELAKVREHVTQQLQAGGYPGPSHAAAARTSLGSIDQIRNSDTSDTASEATFRTAPSIGTFNTARSTGTFYTAPSRAQSPPTPPEIRETMNWRDNVRNSGSFVAEPQSPTSTSRRPASTRPPVRAADPVQSTAEYHAREDELRVQEEILDTIAARVASRTDPDPHAEFGVALARARMEIIKARSKAHIPESAVRNARSRTTQVMDLAHDILSRQQAPPSYTATPELPKQTETKPASLEDPTGQTFEQLRDLDAHLEYISSGLMDLISQTNLRSVVAETIRKARDTLNPVRQNGAQFGPLDRAKTREIGQTVLAAARQEAEAVDRSLARIMQAEENLNNAARDRVSEEEATRLNREEQHAAELQRAHMQAQELGQDVQGGEPARRVRWIDQQMNGQDHQGQQLPRIQDLRNIGLSQRDMAHFRGFLEFRHRAGQISAEELANILSWPGYYDNNGAPFLLGPNRTRLYLRSVLPSPWDTLP
ncbi:hypothetical protein N0V83_001786 [Neocucurbitaria cava]|uniref:Uncharacterized protein n=1 Tax=Neocucurbitaria cava TaxID=798079 RepID=A0A9W8YG94_9PLEO|nr:hypothetical protein N0V83_001786 [Neocucurbitaria cava]